MKSKYIMIMVALMAFLAIVMPVQAETDHIATYINQGAKVFVGEEGLDVTNALDGHSSIGYWSTGAGFDSAPYEISITDANRGNFAIDASQFSGRTGNWYQITGGVRDKVAFYVENPTLEISIRSKTDDTNIDGKTISAATPVTFEISTNVALGADSKRGDNLEAILSNTATTTGYVDIYVKSDNGATYSLLRTTDSLSTSLKDQLIKNSEQDWVNSTSGIPVAWKVDAVSNNQRVYPNGNYTVWAKFDVNGMAVTSDTTSVKVGSSTLKIESNKDSVVRGKSFVVTITGQPNYPYMLYLKGLTGSISAPKFAVGQDGIEHVNSETNVTIKTDSNGQRLIEFTTSSDTKDQKYNIRVQDQNNPQKYDEVSVNVVKGGMTLVASGDQTYYLGEEIKLSGTNSESDTTYFFLIGPNLDPNGVDLQNPQESIGDVQATSTDVNSDDYTYSYEWGTSAINLDAGTYTVYAVSRDVDKENKFVDKSNLDDVVYATTSVVIKKPFVSAHASQSTVAKGDKVFIEGVAEGNPSKGVAIWVLGKNYATRDTEAVDSDGTFKYEVSGAITGSLSSGQYFIVVQHPMQNGDFDVDISDTDSDFVKNYVLNGGTNIFRLYGSGSLQGSDAAEALVQAINDPNIDDTYTKLNILVEEPVIAIDTIGDKQVGDKFTVTGKTNLAVDDEILVEMYSSSFAPTQKSQSGEFSGATQTVKVVKSDAGLNTFSLEVDASTFKPDEYIVLAEGIVVDATGTTLFNVLDYQPTPVPTTVPTTVATVATIPPTVPPTEIPTVVPTETTKSPGFGAVLALAGLMGVAFIVMRRH